MRPNVSPLPAFESCVFGGSVQQELGLRMEPDEASFKGFLSALARSHGCPTLHTL
jgi:hypothetical protein